MQKTTEQKPKRADGQITGLSGELFVAAELLKRGIQTSITFGNAKAIDLLAHNTNTGKNFTIQVKTIRKKNVFPIAHSKVKADHIYIFVILNQINEAVQYFIIPGETLKNDPDKFTHWFKNEKFPGINWKVLKDLGYENSWKFFDA